MTWDLGIMFGLTVIIVGFCFRIIMEHRDHTQQNKDILNLLGRIARKLNLNGT